MWGYVGRTVENRGDEKSGEIGLLRKVNFVRDLRSIKVVGPWLLLSVGHGSDAHEGGFWQRRGMS